MAGATLEVGPRARFGSIGAAIENARAGDTIEVRPGVYKEKPVVDKTVTLRGLDFPVVDGGGTGSVVVIKAPGVVMEGFRVRSGGTALEDNDSGIFVEGSATGAVVRGNIVEDSSFGIWINGTKDIKILKNRVVGKKELISQKRGNGINLWNSADALVEGNDIKWARDGILVSVTKKSLIKGNRIHDLRYGVHYMYADGNTLEGNETFNCRAGLAIMFSKDLDIRNNTSYDNTEYGILFRDLMDSHVEGNTVARNGKGFFFYNSLYNEVRRNLVAENDIGAHIWAGSIDNRVYENSFIRNRTQIKYVGMEDEPWGYNGVGNHWSDYLGWDLDGDGIGDVPYEANTLMERLIWSYPLVKLLLNSPAVQTLRMVEAQFPVLRAAGIVDNSPLMRPTTKDWRRWVADGN